MSDKVEVQIGIAQGRKSFSILEAAMLWCELDSHDKGIEKWIRAMHEPRKSPIDASILYSPYLPTEVTRRLRDLSGKINEKLAIEKVEFDPDKVNALAAEIQTLKNQAIEELQSIGKSEALKKHEVMRDMVSTLVRNMNEICGGERNDLDKKISKDQLKELAKIRKETPRFLGGKDDEEIQPKTRTTWLRLLAATFLEAGYDPREKGMIDAVTAMTERHGLAIPRSTIAKILKEIKDEEVLL